MKVIKEIKKLNIEKGDTIVVIVDRHIDIAAMSAINRGIGTALEKIGLTLSEIPVLVLDKGIKIDKVNLCETCRDKAKRGVLRCEEDISNNTGD